MRAVHSMLVAVAFLALVPGAGAETLTSHANIPLWEDGKVPLATGDGPLDRPFLTVFLPPAGKRNGASVIVAPGGANIMLMYGGEGIDIAERFNDWGVTAFVLTYRLSPKYRRRTRGSLDGKRAIQLVRARAAEWKLDPGADRLHRILGRVEHGRARWWPRRARAIRPRPTRSTASARGRITSRWSTARAARRRASR